MLRLPLRPPLREPLRDAFLRAGNISQAIRALFATGQQGAWYDPSDFSTLFQDSAGTTPVTAVEQPVGLMLDKRLGAVRGPELSTVPNATLTGTAGNVCVSSSSVVAGKTYQISYTYALTSGAIVASFMTGAASQSGNVSGSYTGIFSASGSGLVSIFSNAGVGSITNYSVKLLDGNHASQATAASRPVVSARVNLLVKTEDFADAAWIKSAGASVTPNYGLAPDGTMTAVRVILPASGDVRQFKASPGINTLNSWVKGVVGETLAFLINSIGAPPLFTFTGAWQQIARTDAVNPAEFIVYGTYSGATAKDFQIWHPQLETGTVATRYQRVNTASDYDTAGFPMYGRTDGVDDSMTSATGGGGTAGFFFCQAIKPTGGAGLVRTLWSDSGTNSGYQVQLSASNQLSFSAGNGVAFTTIATATATAVGTTHLLTVWDDGTNLNAQLGSGAVATIARPVVTAGTAGFTIGKDNGAATGFFTGNMYPEVYRQTSLTAAERAQVQAYVRSKAGI